MDCVALEGGIEGLVLVLLLTTRGDVAVCDVVAVAVGAVDPATKVWVWVPAVVDATVQDLPHMAQNR